VGTAAAAVVGLVLVVGSAGDVGGAVDRTVLVVAPTTTAVVVGVGGAAFR
jgi:hypothetical protein